MMEHAKYKCIDCGKEFDEPATESDRMKNNKLSYETIYEKAEIIISSRQVEHKKRTIIKKILQSLKNKAYITDFNEYQKAGKAQGIEIFY